MPHHSPVYRLFLVNIPVVAVLLGMSIAVVAVQAGTTGDGWVSTQAVQGSAPRRNSRLHQQPRPASAPTAIEGHAVELSGDIEFWPLARQPRPMSASPLGSRRTNPTTANLQLP